MKHSHKIRAGFPVHIVQRSSFEKPDEERYQHWWSVIQFSSVQFSRSVMSDSATPWITACQASLSITNSQSSLKLMCIELMMPSSHLILCCPLLLLPPIPPSIRVFSNESTLHMRWPKYWSFSLSISPANEHPGLVSRYNLLCVHCDWFYGNGYWTKNEETRCWFCNDLGQITPIQWSLSFPICKMSCLIITFCHFSFVCSILKALEMLIVLTRSFVSQIMWLWHIW